MVQDAPSTQSMMARRRHVGPRGWPLVGIAPYVKKDYLGYFLRLRREYGDLVRYPAIGRYGYQLNHPDYVQHVLQNNHMNYRKSSAMISRMDEVVGNGLLTSNGDFWMRQRRLAQPAFHPRRIATLGAIMTRAAAHTLATWRFVDDPIDVREQMTRLTLEIAGLSLFGVDLTSRSDDVEVAFSKVNEELARYPTHYVLLRALLPRLPLAKPRNRRFDEGMTRLEDVVRSIIERRRRESAERHDLLAMFMDVRDETTGEGMTDEQLRDEVMTMLLAGHETTALALTWTLLLLSQHPDVESCLHEELDRVTAGEAPTPNDIPRLPYLRSVIEESMRLYPPIHSFNRQAIAEDEIDGYSIPAGAHMLIQPYVIHRHPDLWYEPEVFTPERFAEQRSENRHRYAYLPFGGGPRLCIGAGLAMTELMLVTASIAQRFTLRLAPGQQIAPEATISLRPNARVWMHPHRR